MVDRLMAEIESARLQLHPVTLDEVDLFHSLATDPHIRRYLMDGQVLPVAWAIEQVRLSQRSFEEKGVGIWLVRRKVDSELIGFAGFMGLSGTGLPMELVYALRERHSGAGLAREMAEASIAFARDRAGIREIAASVDAANLHSVKILERLGFRVAEKKQGYFGELLIYHLSHGD